MCRVIDNMFFTPIWTKFSYFILFLEGLYGISLISSQSKMSQVHPTCQEGGLQYSALFSTAVKRCLEMYFFALWISSCLSINLFVSGSLLPFCEWNYTCKQLKIESVNLKWMHASFSFVISCKWSSKTFHFWKDGTT